MMSRVRVNSFSIAFDGFGAGPDQSFEHPLGMGGEALHEWMYRTAMFRAMIGGDGGDTGAEHELAVASFENVGAWILGRNMFGPVRGPWPDASWRGWWGDSPPYHTPVFVLTHHARPPLAMDGGTTFHFVTDGIHAALERARDAADGRDVRIGGGVSVIRQYLNAGLVDEVHLAVSPVALGSGEHLLEGIDLRGRGFRVTRHLGTEHAMRVMLSRDAAPGAG
jgi:dihydrofolate reductase